MKKKKFKAEYFLNKKLVTRLQAAEYFQVCPRTIDNWTLEGKLTVSKIGRRKYYYMSDLLQLIDSNR